MPTATTVAGPGSEPGLDSHVSDDCEVISLQ
jgi:hypothetical protein